MKVTFLKKTVAVIRDGIQAFILLILIFCNTTSTCPYCVGNIEETSPPFFLDECYQDLQMVDTTQTTTEFLTNQKGE